MRINRETLLKVAEQAVTQRVRSDRDIIAAYLSGTLLEESFMLGGTADIDLTFLHMDKPPTEREVQRLTEEVHLDIAHYDQRDFSQARKLRLHPWLGPTIYACKTLYDPQHFLDFTQASVRGQFNRPDYVLERARQQLGHAREIWTGFASQTPGRPTPKDLLTYLRAIDHAANAVACLNGPPLTERRMLLQFPARAEAVGKPGLYPAFLGMLGSSHVDAERLHSWLPGWQASLESLPEQAIPARLHPCRHAYYRRAFEAILQGESPVAVLWPLVRTWALAAALSPEGSPGRNAWAEAGQSLGLLGEGFAERIQALDAFLDLVEETIEQWSRQVGE
jgi:hypothetical protein